MTHPDPKTLDRLLDTALPHVPFSGWSPETLQAAARDAGMTDGEVSAACPGGGADLAARFHTRADDLLTERLAVSGPLEMRIRDKIAHAIRLRLELAGDKEAVRKGIALFALPHHAPRGATLVWQTADAIWRAIGDTSEDVNWYTKRMTLSAVWSSVLLYWLGDTSPNHTATNDFIDRRIDDVMRFEQAKSALKTNPVTRPLTELTGALLRNVRPPRHRTSDDLPGKWVTPAD